MSEVLLVFFSIVMLMCCTPAWCNQGCGTNYTRCGGLASLCTPPLDYSTDTIAFLNDSSNATAQFRLNFHNAIGILKDAGSGIYFDDYADPHVSIQYLCCYSADEYVKIADAIRTVQWDPVQISYENLTCNEDGSGHISIIIPLDADSQVVMMNFVKRLEAAIAAAGIPIHVPRSSQEFFHTTVADALSSYPAADAIAKVNSIIRNFSPMPLTITNFWLLIPPEHFSCTTC